MYALTVRTWPITANRLALIRNGQKLNGKETLMNTWDHGLSHAIGDTCTQLSEEVMHIC